VRHRTSTGRRARMEPVAPEPGRAEPSRAVLLARRLAVVSGAVTLVAVLAVAVFPTRQWLDQRADIGDAEARLAILREQNAALEEQIWRLEDDAEIERLAREQYNLVMPNEEAYVVLPPPLPPVELPPIWPFGPLTDDRSPDPTTGALAPIDP
jgi:cell division protein FtsB